MFSIGISCTGIIPDVEILGGSRERRRTGERGRNEMGDKEGDNESEELIVEMRFLNWKMFSLAFSLSLLLSISFAFSLSFLLLSYSFSILISFSLSLSFSFSFWIFGKLFELSVGSVLTENICTFSIIVCSVFARDEDNKIGIKERFLDLFVPFIILNFLLSILSLLSLELSLLSLSLLSSIFIFMPLEIWVLISLFTMFSSW